MTIARFTALALGTCLSMVAYISSAQTPEPAIEVKKAVAPAILQLDAYEIRARSLVKRLEALDREAAKTDGETLLAMAASLTPAFVQQQPQCSDYLSAALRVRESWTTMDAASMERDYHSDGLLPPMPADGAVCYDMKDLIVHPATALVLLAQDWPDFDQSKKEIEEVLAHLGAVRTVLSQSASGGN
jgi:hypothetical protein